MTKTVLCGVPGIISELREVDSIDQPNGRSTEEMCQWLEFPEGTLSYCTCAQEAVSTKRIWLVTGLQDHRYLSVKSET